MFVIPSKEEVGTISPEIAGEGQKVLLSDGSQVNFAPPPPMPVIPDLSQVKSIRKYFVKQPFQIWPAWLYHPTEPPRIAKNAHEAAELGVCYRAATVEERGRYGVDHVWDWKEDSKWRNKPWQTPKFDPSSPGHGKIYQPQPVNPTVAQNALLAELIPAMGAAVAAAVAKALQEAGNRPASSLDAKEIANSAVNAVFAEESDDKALNALTEEQEWEIWTAEAERKGMHVDKRWSLTRLKDEIAKAEDRRKF